MTKDETCQREFQLCVVLSSKSYDFQLIYKKGTLQCYLNTKN